MNSRHICEERVFRDFLVDHFQAFLFQAAAEPWNAPDSRAAESPGPSPAVTGRKSIPSRSYGKVSLPGGMEGFEGLSKVSVTVRWGGWASGLISGLK